MGRRFFVALGSGRYREMGEAGQLHGVTADVAAMTELFESLGYRSVLSGLGEYEGAEQIRQKLSHWSKDTALTQEDIVVLYFAGHGVVADRDRHYLLCWDSRDDDLAATALPTEDLVRILCRGPLRHLLVVLDTCAGGAGAAEATGVALQSVAYRQSEGGVSTGLWFLASARRKDIAADGAFAAAFRAAVGTTADRTGQRQQYLDLTELVKAVNEDLDQAGRGQRAELASGLVTGLAPFLPNPGFREHLPPLGTDLGMQRRVASRDLAEHFGPRSRGVEFESEQGLYFCGRTRTLDELAGWLTAPDGDGRGRAVTGSPGCGKSAILGRIVALSDSTYRERLWSPGAEPSVVVPTGCVTAAVHARHKRLEEIVERIAQSLGTDAYGTADLLQELNRRGRHGPPVVVVVDAVDEAGSDTAADAGGHGEPRRITRELLRPMSEIPGVRLLVGTRHELITSLGPTFTVLDLDAPGHRADEADVTGYVAKVLLAAEEPEVPTPYRGRPELARTVAAGVARRAAGVYLYARTTARTLRSDSAPVDVTRAGWSDQLPSEIGEAFDDYLARFGPDEPRVRRLLLSLAFSEGKGLPRGRIWTTLSTVISGTECTEEDVSWVLDVAAAYIAEVTDDDKRSVYRLYHKALAEHLRKSAGRSPEAVQSSVVDALTATVPRVSDRATPDWFAAPPYVRQHLSIHAEAADRLTELIKDPRFLLASEPLALLRALTSVSVEGEEARRIRSAYEQIAHRMAADLPLSSRAADLQLSARRCGADALADGLEHIGVQLPWSARWAWWSQSGAHRLLGGHKDAVECVAVGDLDGRPIAATGSRDGTARLWDLTTQAQIGEPLAAGVGVSAIALGEVGDYSVALTGGLDGVVRVWDLSAGQEHGEPLTGHTNRIEAIAVSAVEGRPVALTGSGDGTARLWDLTRRRQLGDALTVHRRTVRAVALGQLDGRPFAVTGGEDKNAHVWDLSGVLDGEQPQLDGWPLTGSQEAVTALAVGPMDGRTVALVGDDEGTLRLWDLATRQQIGQPVTAHVHFNSGGVVSTAIGRIDGVPVALTCGRHEARLWDLRTLRQLGHPLRGHMTYIRAGALADRPEGPMAVTVGTDRTARIWDLKAGQPAAGHSRGVRALAFHEERGRPLALTGSEDGTALLWDLRTRAPAGKPLEGHAGEVRSVALGSCDGRVLAVTGGSDGGLRLWDALRGQTLGSPMEGHTNAVRRCALTVLGDRPVVVSASEDGTLRLWDVRSRDSLLALSGHIGSVLHMSVRTAGRGIEISAATSLDHAYVWSVQDALEAPSARMLSHLHVEDWKRTGFAVGTGFLGDRPLVMCTSEDNSVRALDIHTGELAGAPFTRHVSRVQSAVLGTSEGRAVVATESTDDTVRVWDFATGEQRGEPLIGDVVNLVGTLPPGIAFGRVDGRPVGITAFSREVRVWDLATSQPVGEPLSAEAPRDLVAVSVAPDSASAPVISGSDDGTIRVHAAADGAVVTPHLTSAAFIFGMGAGEAEGETVVLRARYMGMDAWNLTTRRRLWQQPGNWRHGLAHVGEVRRLAVGAALDRSVQAWDLVSGAPTFGRPTGHNAEIFDMRSATLADVEILATASLDGTVRLWDLATGAPLADPLGGHPAGVRAVDLGRLDGRDVALTGAGDGRLRLWDLATGRSETLPPVPSAAPIAAVRLATLHGRPVVICADTFGLLRVWDGRTGAGIAEADLGGGINDLAVTGEGQVYAATRMGLLALSFPASAQDGGEA